MPQPPLLEIAVTSPLAMIGRRTLAVLSYLGSLGTLAGAAARAVVRAPEGSAPFVAAAWRQATSTLVLAAPLVALVHVGLGSFLSMQSYFGGTFVDGTGAVVGVGLIRNVAPLMTGLTLVGLFASWTTAELRGRGTWTLADPRAIADREALPEHLAAPRRRPEPARLVAVRVAGAMVAGLVLTVWAVAVGTLVGWQVSRSLLGVSTHAFFYMFSEMIWLRDVAGLAVKGLAFPAIASLSACHEGLRGPAGPGASCRAACVAAAAILALNSGWFLLVYHAGAAFGPTLMAPPGR